MQKNKKNIYFDCKIVSTFFEKPVQFSQRVMPDDYDSEKYFIENAGFVKTEDGKRAIVKFYMTVEKEKVDE